MYLLSLIERVYKTNLHTYTMISSGVRTLEEIACNPCCRVSVGTEFRMASRRWLRIIV